MGGLFSKPKPPKIEPAPKVEDKAIQEAAAEALRRRQRAKGYRSTILSQMAQGQGPQQTFGT